MKKNKEKKNEELYDSTKFLTKYLTIEIIVLYVTLILGNILMIFFDSEFMYRYIPIAVVTLISTGLLIMSNAKKSKKSEEEVIRKKCFIAPIIIAIIMMFYGFYSVASNIQNAKDELEMYEVFYGEEGLEALIEEGRRSANQIWIITSIVYIAVAEGVTVVTTKKLNKWLKEEVVTAYNSELYASNEFNIQNPPVSESMNNSEVNNINWNL